MTSLISLVVTTYNRERYLERTLGSILQQTHGDFQLLIWDDGSEDGTLELARGFAEQDKRIEFVAAPHLGRGAALAKAVARTHGPFLGWVDSDDMLAPTALADTLAVLRERPEVGLVYTDCYSIDRFNQVLGLGKRSQIPYSRDRLLVDFMTFHFRLVRRSVYNQIGGLDPSFDTAQDYDICLRLSEVTEVVHLPKPLYFYRQHRESISQARQREQLASSERAIRNALERRGLKDKLELQVRLRPEFRLQKPAKAGPKILGIGLEHTGNRSLQEALVALGYEVLYEPQRLIDLDYADGAVGTPIPIAYPDLDRYYAGSKFVLTMRDVEFWLESWEQQELQRQESSGEKLSDLSKQARRQIFGQWQYDPDVWRATYERYQEKVLGYFQHREADLLILNIFNREDRNKLATFLEDKIHIAPSPKSRERT